MLAVIPDPACATVRGPKRATGEDLALKLPDTVDGGELEEAH